MEPTVKYRISMVTASFMVAVNLIADLVQFLFTLTVVLVPVNTLITFLVGIVNYVWLLILGVPLFGGKKAGSKITSAFVTSVAEIVPVIDALPVLTVGIIAIIRASRAEDREIGAANVQVQ